MVRRRRSNIHTLGVVLAGILALAMTLSLFSCAPEAAPATETEAAPATETEAAPATEAVPEEVPEAKGEITYWTWMICDKTIELFEEKNPNIKVNVLYQQPWDMHDKLLIALATGVGAPDVMQCVLMRLDMFAGPNLEDLSDIINKEDFPPSAIAMNTFDGKLCGAPMGFAPMVVFYRRDLFEQYGIKAPIETWDEFVEIGKRFTGPDLYMMPMYSPGGQWGSWFFEAFLQSRGGNIFDENRKVIKNNELAADTLEFYTGLQTTLKIASPEQYWTPSIYAQMARDRYLTLPISVGAIRDFNSSLIDQKGKWSVMPWPKWGKDAEPQTGLWGDSSFIIPIQAKNKEAAKVFTKFITASVDGATAFFQEVGDMPHLIAARQEPSWLDYTDTYLVGPNLAQVVEGQFIPPFFIRREPVTNTIIGNHLDRVFAGEETAEEAWKNIEQELLKEFGE